MITGFEKETHELTVYELETVLPAVIKGLKLRIGKDSAITSTEAIKKMKIFGIKISSPRWRKIINHIRIQGLISHLVSSSKGYYIATSPNEVKEYLDSLRERINSITMVYDALEYQQNRFKKF
jgi:hypothetical protein